jgi:hypothetical protein
MLDIAVAYNRYRFLGNEFLTWVWFCIENDDTALKKADQDMIELAVGNRMVLENRLANGIESIAIKGDSAGLEEALLALSKGAFITEINLVYKSGPLQWQFSLKGENLSFAGLKLPETAPSESSEDIEGMVLEKLYLYEKPFQYLDRLYREFIRVRLSPQWQNDTLGRIKKWVSSARSSSVHN